jgi:hypothetical protein
MGKGNFHCCGEYNGLYWGDFFFTPKFVSSSTGLLKQTNKKKKTRRKKGKRDLSKCVSIKAEGISCV